MGEIASTVGCSYASTDTSKTRNKSTTCLSTPCFKIKHETLQKKDKKSKQKREKKKDKNKSKISSSIMILSPESKPMPPNKNKLILSNSEALSDNKLNLIDETSDNTTTKISEKTQFDQTVTKCNTNTAWDKCPSTTRLIQALTFYDKLDIKSNIKAQNSFLEFFDERYPQLIDDYAHLTQFHAKDLQDINHSLQFCNVTECNYMKRHFEQQDAGANGIQLNFYRDIMDSLHFHIHHIYDCGFRTDVKEENDEKTDEQSDKAFSRMNKIIMEKRKITEPFARFANNTKYMIITNDRENSTVTFLDALYNHLLEWNFDETQRLHELINLQEYDTDAITFDIALDGNISHVTQSANKIKNFLKDTQIISESFSIGLKFYYWSYYRTISQIPNGEKRPWDHDHGGHIISHLYVAKKYQSFKHEIAEYQHFDLVVYKDVEFKVRKYLSSEYAKTLLAQETACAFLHHKIDANTPIRFYHLLSVVLYTDYTDLATDFSTTFRARAENPYETMPMIKKRNRKYYWLSKHLRESVEIYGNTGEGIYDEEFGDFVNRLSGPFYCGISVVLNVPQFSIRLCAPTSTTMHIEIAAQFAGEKMVMIMKLNNSHKDSDFQHKYVSAFNCVWISKYKEEDERLFFGGHHTVAVQSVMLMGTNESFGQFFRTFHAFDAMITGSRGMFGVKALVIKKRDVSIINNVMKHVLLEPNKKDLHEYVYSTFKSFVSHKKQIVLDLRALIQTNENMRNLLMHTMEEEKAADVTIRGHDDYTNLFDSRLLNVLKNVNTVIINTTEWYKNDRSYSISLPALLELCRRHRLKQVTIKAITIKDVNWLCSLWSSERTKLQQLYSKAHYTISEESVQRWRSAEFWLVIRQQEQE